ncbi:MAG: DUF4226 domain-containing protein [Actinomycetia bacterium]|nr:DUF4226 domain-containing protein [Actinomycetes bacterium]
MASAAEVVEAIDHILRYEPDWRGSLNDGDFTALNEMYDRAKNNPQEWLIDRDLPIHIDDKYLGALRLDNPTLFDEATPINPPGQAPATQPAAADVGPTGPGQTTSPSGEGFNGRAAEAAQRVDEALAKNSTALAEADEELVDAVLGAKTGSQQGQAQLRALQETLVDQIHKLGPTLDTPAGQQQLNDFLQGKVQEILGIVKSSGMDAQSKAEVLDALTQRYAAVDDSGGPGTTAPGQTGPGTTTAPQPGSTGGTGGTGALPDDPLLNGLISDPFMDGLGALAGPAMGALGGLPAAMGSMIPGLGGMGGGLPLGDLGGALGGAIRDASARGADDPGAGLQEDPSITKVGENGESQSDGEPPTEGEKTDPDENGPAAKPGEGEQPPVLPAEAGQAPPVQPGPDVSVELPDGSTIAAESPQLAHVGRLVVDGTNLDDAAAQAQVTLLPAGSPVSEPVSPSQLQPMDYAQFTDHRVMALGGDKVWLNGQVTPVSEMPTGPNFLGWARPQVQSAPAATVLAGAN